jgi:hypothetical protein
MLLASAVSALSTAPKALPTLLWATFWMDSSAPSIARWRQARRRFGYQLVSPDRVGRQFLLFGHQTPCLVCFKSGGVASFSSAARSAEALYSIGKTETKGQSFIELGHPLSAELSDPLAYLVASDRYRLIGHDLRCQS